MIDASSQTAHLQDLIERLPRGDTATREELLACAAERLRRLTRRMCQSERRLKRWEQTDDVFQNASLRLYMALADVTPATVREFFRLAAVHIRRELIDLARHYYGPQGIGSRQDPPGPDRRDTATQDEGTDTTHEPSRLAAWREFHEQVTALPVEERELFDLLWYQGLSQAEAAGILGISERTLQRRWQSARLRLHRALHGVLPG